MIEGPKMAAALQNGLVPQDITEGKSDVGSNE